MADVKKRPEGYHTLTPYFCFKSADAAISWYRDALGATEVYRFPTPDGGVAHAELQIGDSRLMLSDEMPAWGNKSAQTMGGSPIGFHVYVDDADTAFDRAIKAGATVQRPVVNQFYGDRSGTFIDPFGYQWTVGTHIEDVSNEELSARMRKMFTGAASS